jgi:hypothetical protein
MIYASIQFAM